MAKIFRTMRPDKSGLKPKLGCEDGPGIGVRVPPDPKPDVRPDASGNIYPGSGGMSVSPSVVALLPHLIPRRWKHTYRLASGSNLNEVWHMGDGSFVDASIAVALKLRVTSDTHGLVEPESAVTLQQFLSHLAATQNDWKKVEH